MQRSCSDTSLQQVSPNERFQIHYSNHTETSTTCQPTLTHVKQVLLWALFGCSCHTLCHIFRLCLQCCEHLGVDLLSVHICRHISCFWCLTFTLRHAAYIKWSYRRHGEKQSEQLTAKLCLMYLSSGKNGSPYPVVWIWAFFHRPSFLHSAAPGNMSDLLNLGPSDDIKTHGY